MAAALSRRATGGGGGGEDGESDDDDWDMSEDDWSEEEEDNEMGFCFFAVDEVSDVKARPLSVERYYAVDQLADAKKPTVTLKELNTLFTAQKQVYKILRSLRLRFSVLVSTGWIVDNY